MSGNQGYCLVDNQKAHRHNMPYSFEMTLVKLFKLSANISLHLFVSMLSKAASVVLSLLLQFQEAWLQLKWTLKALILYIGVRCEFSFRDY